ncbi:asparagine--tRNA ligase, partial [Halodesulfovibrio aestuarii]
MRRTPIVDALQAEEASKEVKICGWVRTRRDAKGFSFLELNDGSCLKNLQAIVDESIPTYEIIKDVTTGAAVEVLGELVPSPGKGQKWEVRVTELKLLGTADADEFPLQKKRHSDEFLRQIAHLRPRTNKFGAAFRIRSEAAFAIHKFYRDKGFFNVHTPILTGSDCEGAGEMFRVSTLPATGVEVPKEGSVFENDFFGREANLTVSGQLEAELLAMGLGKVYTFGPTFRAENSNTPRHAAEFWMIEPEVAFADNEDNMDLAEEMTKYVVKHILDNCADDIELFAKFVDKELMGRLENIINEPFARVSYTEAVELLLAAKKKWEFPVEWGIDLQTEHERYLAEEHFKKPVIVYDYPKDIKAFYMRMNDDGKTVAAMDVLVPRIGELIGGSQREERMDVLLERINEMGQNPEDYWWYTDLR